MDCPLQYVGQTGWSFQATYNEHTCAMRHNKHASTYVQTHNREGTRVWKHTKHNGNNQNRQQR